MIQLIVVDIASFNMLIFLLIHLHDSGFLCGLSMHPYVPHPPMLKCPGMVQFTVRPCNRKMHIRTYVYTMLRHHNTVGIWKKIGSFLMWMFRLLMQTGWRCPDHWSFFSWFPLASLPAQSASLVGVIICLVIGCYLLQEHIRASGGFRNSFTRSHGISNTIGIILLLVYPVWCIVLHFL